jgi:hypothetical protein
MSSKIYQHDVVAGTRLLDIDTLISREMDTKMVKRSVLLLETLKIEKINGDLSSQPFLHCKIRKNKPLDTSGST